MSGGTLTVEQQQTLANLDAFKRNSALMNQIVREMKLIPELPSEKPTDVNPLIKVEFPDRGGVLTYMEGYEYPYKGFPFFEFVDKIDSIKKIQRATLSSLFHSFKVRPWWQKFLLIVVPWLWGDLMRAYIYTFFRTVDRFKLKPERYCDSVRELYRAFSADWHDEEPHIKEMRHMVRDIVCMFLEFDNAYRFRFQDIIVELNKESLQRNSGKEIIRLFSLMQTREKQQEIKDTWTLVKFFLPWYLRFNKTLRKNVLGILLDLDLEKVALALEDKIYCERRKDYQFGFITWQQNSSTLNTGIPRNQDSRSGMRLQLSPSGLPPQVQESSLLV